MGLSGDHGRLIKWHQPDNFAFVERSRTMKAPVGLLSDRTVLRSKMEGLCPDKFQFAVLGSSRFWGRRSPTRAPSKSNKCLNADPEQQRPKAGYHHGDGILPLVLYPPVLSWESVVYSSWFNKSEFVERFPELSLFYRLSSPLDSEMICIFPYFCPCEESAREIREILCQSM